MVHSIEYKGILTGDCSVSGQGRDKLIHPAHPNGIRLSRDRWLLLYGSRGFDGGDDERSALYQIRRDGFDGPVIREGVLASWTDDWQPLDDGKRYRKQHGQMAEHGILSEALLAQTLRGREAGKRLAGRYRLLLLPGIVAMADLDQDGLAAYQECGGTILSTESLPIEGTVPGASGERTIYREPPGQNAAAQACLSALENRLPNRVFRPGNDAAGWQFNLYRRGPTHFLHFLNLRGTRFVDGQIVPGAQSLRFEIPSSGFLECVLRLETSHRWKAELFSPQGAESEAVEIIARGLETHLRIPVGQATQYGIVRIQPHT